MNRIRTTMLPLLAVGVSAIGVPAVAHAASTHHPSSRTVTVTGGQSTITASQQAVNFLTARKVQVSAVAPATSSGDSITLPVSGGTVSKSHPYAGVVRLGGGIAFARDSHTVVLRNLEFIDVLHHLVLASRPRAGVLVLLARAKHVTVTHTGSDATVTGDLALTRAGARRIDRRLGGQVRAVKAGDALGSFTLELTLA